MTPPIFAGYCPRTTDTGPVDLAAALARLTGAPLAVAAISSGGTVVDEPWGGEYADQPRVDARGAADDRRRLRADRRGPRGAGDRRPAGARDRRPSARSRRRSPRWPATSSTRPTSSSRTPPTGWPPPPSTGVHGALERLVEAAGTAGAEA